MGWLLAAAGRSPAVVKPDMVGRTQSFPWQGSPAYAAPRTCAGHREADDKNKYSLPPHLSMKAGLGAGWWGGVARPVAGPGCADSRAT